MKLEVLSSSLVADCVRAFLAKRSLLVLLRVKFLIWMKLRKKTGALKKMVSKIDKTMTVYLSQTISHPTHSSMSGQSLPSGQGAIIVSKQLATMAMKQSESDMRKTKKLLWLLTPTQLFSQGQ